MTNIVDKYGREWFANKFNGSYFSYRGVPARVLQPERDPHNRNKTVVLTALCPRVNDEVKSIQARIPADYFTDSGMFSVPELGYRHADNGKGLYFLRRNNASYVRGLSTRNIQVYESDFTRYLRTIGVRSPALNENQLNNIVIEPNFIPLYKGIKLMLSGKLLSFAASAAVAVVPSANEDSSLTILMCDKQIGTVSASGVVSMSLPTAQSYVEEMLCK